MEIRKFKSLDFNFIRNLNLPKYINMKKIYQLDRFQNQKSAFSALLLKLCLATVFVLSLMPLSAKAQQVYTVVEGTYQVDLQGVSPFATIAKNQRSQYLYIGDYLQNLDAPAGYITAVALKITQIALPSGIKPENLQLKMGLTSLTSLPESLIPNLPVHYSTASENIAGTGWYTFTLDTPLYWDGYSNIVMEFCRTNTLTGSSFEIEVDLGLINEYRSAGLHNNIENSNGCTLEGNTTISLPNRRLLPSMRITMTDPCTTNPAAGTVVVSEGNDYCAAPFTLSVINDSFQSGLSYQWQYSSNNGEDFVDIPGATFPELTTSQEFSTYYRRGIMCDALGAMIYPPALYVSGPGCLCNPTVTTVDATGITNVTFGSINNTSSSAPSFTDFRNESSNVHLLEMLELSARVTVATTAVYTKAWIDWNQDGIFSASEAYELGMVNSGTDVSSGAVATVIVPADALLGTTVMRVRTASVADMASLEPCGLTSNGESEDYSITVMPELGIHNSEILKSSIVVFASDKLINIRSTVENIKSIKILDISGRTLYNSQSSDKQTSIALPAIASQILVVEVTTESGFSVNRKVNLK